MLARRACRQRYQPLAFDPSKLARVLPRPAASVAGPFAATVVLEIRHMVRADHRQFVAVEPRAFLRHIYIP